jgi:hypothetical protein
MLRKQATRMMCVNARRGDYAAGNIGEVMRLTFYLRGNRIAAGGPYRGL